MNRLIIGALIACLPLLGAAQTTAVVNAKVHTVGPDGTVDNATILIVDGRIAAVGTDVTVPPDANRIDVTGKVVTPGLFSARGAIGLMDVGLSAGPLDYAQRSDQFTAGFDVANAYNARSPGVTINRIEGVTRAAITPTPGSADELGRTGHVLAGLGAIVSLGDGGDIIRRNAALVVALGEPGAAYAGGSRTAAWLIVRNALDEAIDYRANKGDYARGARRPYRHSMADLDALQGVLAGETPLLVSIDRAADIEALIGLVEEYNLRAIVDGGVEAWMVAPQLARADIAVILSPAENLPGNFDRLNARRGAAKLLADAGVRVVFSAGGDNAHNPRNMTQLAGIAVADGLDWDQALRAITLTPAEIYGVAAETGSIEVGKLADLVIWPGDPLELTNFAEQVLIGGELLPMQSRQTLLRDRYLDPADTSPPAWRK